LRGLKMTNTSLVTTSERQIPSLDYFVEWGGGRWEHFCRYALQDLGPLRGRRILEIGPRFGRLSSYFALLGAQVVGIDIDAVALMQAEREAARWGVQDRVSFVHYDGRLDRCEALSGAEFDVVFTKSVLVSLGCGLEEYLRQIDRKLGPSGRCVFIENRSGGALFSLARRVLPTQRGYYRWVTYLTDSHLKSIGEVFHITEVKKSLLPPIYLILARKTAGGVVSTAGNVLL